MEESLRGAAVRIEEEHALPVPDIIQDYSLHQGRLAAPRRPYDLDALAAHVRRDTDRIRRFSSRIPRDRPPDRQYAWVLVNLLSVSVRRHNHLQA